MGQGQGQGHMTAKTLKQGAKLAVSKPGFGWNLRGTIFES